MVAVNKLDLARPGQVEQLRGWSQERLGVDAVGISAVTGEGLEALRSALASLLPESPFLYPEDDLAVQPVRFFVEELIRETIFEEYGQEVPYAAAVRVEEFREAEDPVYISARVYVERGSQKGILIGKGGEAIKRLGTRARMKIEAFIGRPVYLDLWVKPLPGWRKQAASLKRLGYRTATED
jgi:GTPase